MRAVVMDRIGGPLEVRDVLDPVAPADGVVVEVRATGLCRSDWHAWAGHDEIALPHVPGHELAGTVRAVGVGLSTVMIAKALGARVIAVDRNAGALDAARALGADHVLVSRADGAGAVPDQVHEITNGGSHVAIDAVGSETTCAESILSLRRRGRHVQVGLLPPVAGHPRVPMARAIGWELDLFGSHGMAAADYPGMLALIESGALRPQDLIERIIGLHEAAALLPAFDKASPAGMTMIDPRG